jgi:hypothetical protein
MRTANLSEAQAWRPTREVYWYDEEKKPILFPEFCCAVHNTTGETILITRGERGYWDAPQWDARRFNDVRGISPMVAAAMFMGSMFGWDAPAAQPTRHTNEEAERTVYGGTKR